MRVLFEMETTTFEHAPSPLSSGEKVADRPDEGVVEPAIVRTKPPSPCRLSKFVGGDTATVYRVQTCKRIGGEGDTFGWFQSEQSVL